MIQPGKPDFFHIIKAAHERLAKQRPDKPCDFVVLNHKMVELYEKLDGFEPLAAYIDEVHPYNGEVGRYYANGMKIRIIQQKELRCCR